MSVISERQASWLGADDRCPDWCKAAHLDDDPPERQSHQSWVESDPPGSWGLAYLHRSWADDQPTITVTKAYPGRESSGTELTLLEARDLAIKLLGLVAAGQGYSGESVTPGP